MTKAINRDLVSRQRFTFTVCSQFPKERELLAHLFKLPRGQKGVLALQFILIGLESSSRPIRSDFDDNFPWSSPVIDIPEFMNGETTPLKKLRHRFQLSLYADVPEHVKLMELTQNISSERRADVLRCLALRGLRIHIVGRRLASESFQNYREPTNRKEQAETNVFEKIAPGNAMENLGRQAQNKRISETGLLQSTAVETTAVFEVSKKEKKDVEALHKPIPFETEPIVVVEDQNIRGKVPSFRRSAEFQPPGSLHPPGELRNNRLKEMKYDGSDGVNIVERADPVLFEKRPGEFEDQLITKAEPMKPREEKSAALSGLAAMMGGFVGMESDGQMAKN